MLPKEQQGPGLGLATTLGEGALEGGQGEQVAEKLLSIQQCLEESCAGESRPALGWLTRQVISCHHKALSN